MNKTEFLKRVEKEISETKERLKRTKEKENYYESVKDFGEDYTKAKFNRIKEEQALLYLEPFVNLPEILYTVSASSDVIGVHKKEEIDKISKRINKVHKSLSADDMKLAELFREEAELISTYTKTNSKSVKKTTEDKKALYEARKKGAIVRDSKKQTRDVKSRKEKELEMWVQKGLELMSMPDELYRIQLLNEIEDSEEVFKMSNDALEQKDGCKVFASVANDPKAVKHLSFLLHKLKIAETSRRDPVKFEKEKIDKLNIPDDLKTDIFDNSNIYSQVFEDICDPNIGIDTIKEYIEAVEDEIVELSHIYDELDDFGIGLVALDKYEKACKEAGGKKLVYGDPENTKEQNSLFEYFTFNRTYNFELNPNGISIADVIAVDNIFKGHELPIFFSRKKERNVKCEVSEKQIELYRKKRAYLERKLNGLVHLNVDKSILYEKAIKEKNIVDIEEEYNDDLLNRLNELLKLFETFKKQYEDNIQKHNDKVRAAVEEILDFTGCEKYDINRLIINDTGDDLITRIYEYAAMFNAAKLVEEIDKDASIISIREQSSLYGMSVEELALKLLNKQEERHERELAEEHRETIRETIDRVRRLTNKPKRHRDYLSGATAWIDDFDDDDF